MPATVPNLNHSFIPHISGVSYQTVGLDSSPGVLIAANLDRSLRSIVFRIRLLLNVVLGATLLRLAGVVLVAVVLLSLGVTCEARDRGAHSASDAVANTRDIVVDLALSLLVLALLILVAACGLKRLRTH